MYIEQRKMYGAVEKQLILSRPIEGRDSSSPPVVAVIILVLSAVAVLQASNSPNFEAQSPQLAMDYTAVNTDEGNHIKTTSRLYPAFQSQGYSRSPPEQQLSGPDWPQLNASKQAHLFLDPTLETANVTEFYFGTNLPNYLLASFVNETETSVLENTGVKFLRYPGGSPANRFLWDGDYDRYPFFSNWSWMAGSKKYQIGDFARSVTMLGAVPLVQINAALALIYGAESCAEYAIEWHEAFLALGVNVTYYEFGNENYGDWEVPFRNPHFPVNGTTYGRALATVSKRMKEIYPYVMIGAVVNEDLVVIDPDDTIVKNWTREVLKTEAASQSDFLILHNYFVVNNTSPSYAELFSEVSTMKKMVTRLKNIFHDVHPNRAVPPMILSEYHMVETSSAACARTIQFIAALWHALALAETVKDSESFQSLMGFAWADKTKNCTHYSDSAEGSVGDYGMFAMNDYHRGVNDGAPRTSFYTHALFNLAFGSRVVHSTFVNSTCSPDLHVYASTFTGGEIGLVIINLGSEACTINVDAGEANEESSVGTRHANGWILQSSAPDSLDPLSAEGVQWNGHPGPLKMPLQGSYEPYMLEYSAIQGSTQFDVPRFSLAGMVCYD